MPCAVLLPIGSTKREELRFQTIQALIFHLVCILTKVIKALVSMKARGHIVAMILPPL